MASPYLIFMGLIALIATALFYDQALNVFQGLSVLESLKLIINFMLHVIVVTILSFMAVKLPEMISPWARLLKRWTRAKTKPRRTEAKAVAARKAPQLTQAERLIRLMMLMNNQGKPKMVRMFKNKDKKRNNIFLKF